MAHVELLNTKLPAKYIQTVESLEKSNNILEFVLWGQSSSSKR